MKCNYVFHRFSFLNSAYFSAFFASRFPISCNIFYTPASVVSTPVRWNCTATGTSSSLPPVDVISDPPVRDDDMSCVSEYSIHLRRIFEANSQQGDPSEAFSRPTPPSPGSLRQKVYQSSRFDRGTGTIQSKVDYEKGKALIKMWRESPHNPELERGGMASVASKVDCAGDERGKALRPAPATPPKPGCSFRDTRPVDVNEPVESKRRRLIYQSQYRGMVEMDLICGHFARCQVSSLSKEELEEYDVLLKQLDNDLFKWLVMGEAAPEHIKKLRCFERIRKFVLEERKELLGHY